MVGAIIPLVSGGGAKVVTPPLGSSDWLMGGIFLFLGGGLSLSSSHFRFHSSP